MIVRVPESDVVHDGIRSVRLAYDSIVCKKGFWENKENEESILVYCGN